MNVSAITAAVLTIGCELEALDNQDRAAVFALLRCDFCLGCGADQPSEGPGCQCENDD